MKTYIKKRILLANNQTYQMDYDAKITIINAEASANVTLLLRPDHEDGVGSNFGIVEKDLPAGIMKQGDSLLPKGLLKASGGTIEVFVWY
jgi:hypothetical protein